MGRPKKVFLNREEMQEAINEGVIPSIRSRNSVDQEPAVTQLIADMHSGRFSCEVSAFIMNVNDDLMKETRGSPQSAIARQLAMYFAHTGFGLSLHRVGISFGRDRSTVAHAAHLIEDMRDTPEFDLLLDQVSEAMGQIDAAAKRFQASKSYAQITKTKTK